MTIKEYLDTIGIHFEDEKEALNFLDQTDVKIFLSEKFEETNISTTSTSDWEEEKADIKENINQTNAMIRYTGDNEPMSESEKQEAKEKAFESQICAAGFNLQNGRMNQPYSFVIDPAFIIDNGIGEFRFEGLEDLGLLFNKETNTIEGIPLKAGDFKISWFYKSVDSDLDRPMLKREITLVINPDPRSLWNNIPTPPDLIFYKPDCATKYLSVEGSKGFLGLGKDIHKNMVAASQRGRAHAHEGKPRDDDFSLFFDSDNQWYIMAVADGAGSVQHSRRGAEIACQTVQEVCKNKLQESSDQLERLISNYNKDNSEENKKQVGDLVYHILGNAVFQSYKNIKEEAENHNSEIRDFSTTLLFAICKKLKTGWFIASFWVGDGGIGIYNKEENTLKVMGESDGGEFAGQTRFLTMSEIIQPDEIYRRMRFEIVENFTALILMTDGITDPKFETEANLMRVEKWNNLWNDLNREVEFKDDFDCSAQLLKWLDFWVPGNHDDRTIAILY